ncbi:DUF4270 family protein [Olivibacter sp. SDN3]|uniref:DUF4270 family protein n=1 Tax=Olivibacter sp. SDN3 TaxID=2764720 RepID=UPI00165109C0|nr:DUF4270 family protein [Olivibacter sp. SDN3]QNL51425.1 DUF4270 family protein [Olivibacter sp. SDN3]
MKYYTRDLLTLLISLFILSSCENPAGIGLDNNPGDSFYGILNDTLTLHTATVRDDSASTTPTQGQSQSNILGIPVNQLPLGFLKDDIIGETHAAIAMAVDRSSGDSRLPENAQIDSAVLVLRYGNSFVGDSLSSTHQLEVRQLDEVFNSTVQYFTSKDWPVTNEVVGSAQLNRFNLKDSISVNVRGSSGQDSSVRVPPQLRVRLDHNFISTLLAHDIDSATINSDNGFRNHAKGLYLSLNQSGQQGIGGIATLSNAEANGVEISYRVTDSEGNTDTLSKRLPIYNANGPTLAASVRSTYSTEVQNQLANSAVNQTTVYAQGMGGLRTRISFPYIDELKGKKIAINRAELVVYVDEEHMGSIHTPAPRLTLYRGDVAGRNQPIPDGDARPGADPRSQFHIPGVGPFALGGFYESDRKRYVFSMTSFIQDIVLGKVQNSHVYLAPVFGGLNTIPFWPDVNSPDRVVLKGYNAEDAAENSEVRTKLNIYYTELD